MCKLTNGRTFLGKAAIHYIAAGRTDRGRKRSGNEDAFAVGVDLGVYVVCDGMGGAAAGEVASSMAVKVVMHHMAGNLHETPLAEVLERAVNAAGEAIFLHALHNPRCSGMGTTLVSLAVEGARGWVVNVGDSRAYRLRAGQFEQITLDHSLVDEQVRLGRMNAAEARISPLRNVITRALGTQSSVTADVFPLEIAAGDLYLLCSDGLNRELSDERIASILGEPLPLDGLCKQLIDEANKAGGQDNITCVLVRAKS